MMTTIILPDHHLVRHPTIIANPNAPMVFADGGFSKDRGDGFMHITFFASPFGGMGARPVLFVTMPKKGFEQSMVIDAVEFLPGLARQFTRH